MELVNSKQLRICVNKIDDIIDCNENENSMPTAKKLTGPTQSPPHDPGFGPSKEAYTHKWHVAKSSTIYVYKLKNPKLCLQKIDNEWNKIQKERSGSRSQNIPVLPAPAPSEKKHECLACGKSFKQKHHLVQHFDSHTKPFKCMICDQYFGRKDPLVKHIVRVHCYNENNVQKV